MSINNEVTDLIRERLDVGRKRYGGHLPLDDGRDWLEEAIEEALDMSVYLSAYLIKIRHSGKETKQIEVKSAK